jgi:hypothetical protein
LLQHMFDHDYCGVISWMKPIDALTCIFLTEI